MWDGSAIDLDENLQIAAELIEKCAAAKIVLEVEIGVVGGEEDGVSHDINEKLYTAPATSCAPRRPGPRREGRLPARRDLRQRARRLQARQRQAAPEILKEGQDVVAGEFGLGDGAKPFNLVFHGGSGSAQEEIREALSYGVVKMNIDTDTQYAFTRPIAGHMFSNYDGVLKVDGEVGNKKTYDPRTYMKLAETNMAARIVEACEDLLSAGQSQSA
jgi:fructose-bisphosphate aldolase class II